MEVPQILDAQSTMALIAKAELETIVDYKRIKQACTCPSCHVIIDEIIRDEWRHIGCALHVIKHNPEVLALLDEGEKEAMILRAEAKKEAVIAEAEGTATAIKMINEANPNAAYLTLKGYDALKVLADGNATKIVVPSEIQNVTGLLASLKATIEDDKKNK